MKSCHLFEVNAAAAISIIKSKSPSQLLIVGSLPANTNRQQPFPDKVVLSVSEETIQIPEADFAVLVGVQRIENKLLHLFGLPVSQKLYSRNMMRVYYSISPWVLECIGIKEKAITRFLQKGFRNIAFGTFPC